MKHLLLTLSLLLLTICCKAQETKATPHVTFSGIEVKGDIFEFADSLKQHGFSLQKRIGRDWMYIFKGNVYGANCYFQVSYTKNTRSVYRIIAETNRIDVASYIETLVGIYGPNYQVNPNSYQWMVPGGAVMLMVPEGRDPKLVIVDEQGYMLFKDEQDLYENQLD